MSAMWNASLYNYLTRIAIVVLIVFFILSLAGCVPNNPCARR